MVIVFPGDELTRAKDLRARSVLISELLPTLERPENAICGLGSEGICFGFPTLILRFVFCILRAIKGPFPSYLTAGIFVFFTGGMMLSFLSASAASLLCSYATETKGLRRA